MGSAVFSHWTASVLSKRALRRTVCTAAWARNDRYRSASSFYVMLDVYSRYVVGWMIAHRESASLADTFIRRRARRRHCAQIVPFRAHSSQFAGTPTHDDATGSACATGLTRQRCCVAERTWGRAAGSHRSDAGG